MRAAFLVLTMVALVATPLTAQDRRVGPPAPADAARPGRRPPVSVPLAPADAALAAARDALSRPPSEAAYQRYLSLHVWPTVEQRRKKALILSSHLNDLHRLPFEGHLYFVQDLPGGDTTYTVVRLDTREFATDPAQFLKLWEELGGFDTYFHEKVRRVQTVTTTTETEYETAYELADPPPKLETEVKDGNTYVSKPGGRFRYLKQGIDKEGQPRDELTQEHKIELGILVPVKRKKRGPDVTAVDVKEPGPVKTQLAGHLSDDPAPATAKAKAELLDRALKHMSLPDVPCQSPVLLGSWFFVQTATQHGEKYGGKAPGYYDFLGFKTQADFEEATGDDIKRARTTYPEEVWGVVQRSSVAVHNRRLMQLGRSWWTHDAKENVGRRNYREILDTDFRAKTFQTDIGVGSDDAAVNEFDATEALGFLPDGHMATWLANNKKARQNFAPPEIASDGTSVGTDRRVLANKSCKVCHEKGFQDVACVVRRTATNPLALTSPDPEAQNRLRQLYTPDINASVARDQKRYTEMIARSTGGMTTQEFVKEYSELWNEYQERDFDLQTIQNYTGVPKDKLLAAIDRLTQSPQKGGVGVIDPVSSGLLRALVKDDKGKAEREEPIRSEMFEDIFPTLMLYARGAVPTVVPSPGTEPRKKEVSVP